MPYAQSPASRNVEQASDEGRRDMAAERVFSVEFSPPRNPEAVEKLRAARAELARVGPAYYSVTFGAGGSTREGTLSTALEIHAAGLHAVPHISCIATTRPAVHELLETYRRAGIRHLVALRGPHKEPLEIWIQKHQRGALAAKRGGQRD